MDELDSLEPVTAAPSRRARVDPARSAAAEPTSESERKKLLIATDNFLPRHDGIARFLKEILPVLTEQFDVTVVCPDFGPVTLPGVRIERVALSNTVVGDYRVPQFAVRQVAALVREHDLVFTQGVGPVGWSAIRAAHKRVPVVLFMHSIDWELVPKAVSNPLLRAMLPGIVKWWVRRQYERCSLVLVPSEGVAETLLWNHIAVDRRVVHLGVNVNEFTVPRDKAAAKRALGLPKDKLIIGYHGRIAPEKDLKTLLRAFVRIPNAHLLIVGSGVPALEQAFKRPNVTFVGSQDNVVPYLQAMDVYVMPSLTETTCLSVLEAMACGLPVISTPVGYVRDYIEPNVNGILVQKQDSYGIARALKSLQESSILRERLGLAARKTVEARFTWDKTRRRIKEIFGQL